VKAYSLALRERIAAACAQPGRTVGAVAAQFSVSVSFVAKLLQRQRQSGSLAALPHRSGPAALLDATARAELVACLRQPPDATLQELRVWVAALGGPAVSQATLGRAVQALDGRRKKRASTPPRATPPA
jgi:transposase